MLLHNALTFLVRTPSFLLNPTSCFSELEVVCLRPCLLHFTNTTDNLTINTISACHITHNLLINCTCLVDPVLTCLLGRLTEKE